MALKVSAVAAAKLELSSRRDMVARRALDGAGLVSGVAEGIEVEAGSIRGVGLGIVRTSRRI